jgi:hypothetical protein
MLCHVDVILSIGQMTTRAGRAGWAGGLGTAVVMRRTNDGQPRKKSTIVKATCGEGTPYCMVCKIALRVLVGVEDIVRKIFLAFKNVL